MAGTPEKRFSAGLVKATIWKNVSSNGDDFRTVSLSKSYRKDGEWKNTSSLGIDDIDKAIQVLQQARDFLKEGNESEEVVF